MVEKLKSRVFEEKMGVGPDSIKTRVLNVDKLKESKKKEDEVNETGCWIKFRFFGRCISSRSKVESSISGSSTQYGNFSRLEFSNLIHC